MPRKTAKKMPPKLFGDDIPPSNTDPVELEVDEEYRRRLERIREAEDSRRYARAVAEGEIVEDEESESESESDPEEEIGDDEVAKWIASLVKLQKHDPEFLATGQVNDVVEKKDRKKKKKKTKKMYLKDVQAQQLLDDGPEAAEEDEGRVQTYGEQQEALRRAVSDAVEAGGEESDDDEDLLKVKERDDDDDDDDDDDSEENEQLKEMADEYFGKESELGEGDKFLRDYLLKQMWKDKDEKSKTEVIDEAELKQISDDEDMVILQEEFETNYRHEEKAGEMGIVMGQSRIVEGSVRKKDNARKKQRMNKEERNKIAEIERQEELKRLKNVKKKEIKEKMKKVLSIAGFKDGEEFPLNERNLDDEFDPEEYDKMMKAAFDDEYYGAEDSELHSDDDDDDEKPDFDKEDELLGLPKNWDVIQGGDGFTATREKVLKQKENDDEPEEEEEEEEVEEEEEREGKRKRKRKTSLVKRAKEALMEEYYKLDYEDTIGELKTRFKFAKVQPNSYGLEKEEILFLDDTELNQYVPLKKMAPYMEKDWEVNKYKLKEQKHKFSELLEKIDNPEEKRSKKKSKKKSKKREAEEKRDVVKEKKPAAPIADEEGEAETSKLSRKAKRRRREAEKKLPPNRMVAYGKTN